MELEQRPMQPQREWRERASSTSTSPASQRRRTSTVNVRPAGPPPNLPMPSIPPSVSSPTSEQYSSQQSYFDINMAEPLPTSYHRAAPSPNLTALTKFSHSRHQQMQQQQQVVSPSEENLSDSPPRSFLHPQPTRTTQRPNREQSTSSVASTQNSGAHLLAPPDAHGASSSTRRPSPRRTLTRALELAREAVTLDAMNDDPHAAVVAYGKSVALLSEVMERVRRGEESTERRGSNGRRRSIIAQEEEVRRLKSIHDTYADRMNILSLIYHIPPQPLNESYYSTSTTYRDNYSSSATPSATSTQPSSPTSSTPPDSDAQHTQQQHSPRTDAFYIDNPLNMTSETQQPSPNDAEEIGVAMFELQQSAVIDPNTPSPISNYHPFSAQYAESAKPQPVPSQPPTPSNRSSMIARRPRASSILPPPPPPPSSSPPPPPVSVVVEPVPELPPRTHAISRSRGNSITGHHRGNSGSRLESLREENEKFFEDAATKMSMPANGFHENAPRDSNRDSHPLPPLPAQSPTTSEAATPRSDGPPSVAQHNRKRVSSIRQPVELNHLINQSPNMGTISQRRMKSSAPPTASSTRPSSPAGSEDSLGSVGSLVKTPAFGQSSYAGGRTRAASQPGRRPSVVAGFSHETHPPPATAGPTTTQLARTSSHRMVKSPPPLPLLTAGFDHTGTPMSNGAFSSGIMPITPISPLPPTPPTDPLLKPYHLMSLLLVTMTSQSGGYLTRRLHVPQEVWSQGGVKLLNLGEKIKAVSIISASLDDLSMASSECFGAGNVSAGLAMGIGSITKKEGDAWVTKLDEFSSVCENVVTNFGKKLGVGEGFVSRKTTGVTSWGGKLSRGLDKLTNGKNLESPAAYVQGLKQLFQQAQLLDEHTKAAFSTSAPVYNSLPGDVRSQAEMKLKRSSEFFAHVVLTFVIRDLSQLLDKYAKKCEKWLAE